MTPYDNPVVTITNSAKTYLTNALKNHGKSNVLLAVEGGGCNGFQYSWNFIDDPDPDDASSILGHTELKVNEVVDLKLFIDKTSEMFLFGSEIDYISDLGGSYLKINNPMAQSQCGCVTSFSA